MAYYFLEVQGGNPLHTAETLPVTSLISAKRLASQIQMYENTVLVIGQEIDKNGYIPEQAILAVKKDGHWEETKMWIKNEYMRIN